jgi:hypothetical protein
MKIDKYKIYRKLQRQTAMEAGFFDGRFQEKIVEDKRKQENKNHCRNKQNYFNE